jgi:hypothetical protein
MKSLRALVVVAACSACGGASSNTTSTSSPTAKSDAQPAAVVVLLSGWEVFIGNDQAIPAEDPSRYLGHLTELDAAWPKLAALGAGSTAELVVYADRAKVAKKFEPIDKLGKGWAGTQKDYSNTMGIELVAGLQLAGKELDAAPTGQRRALLVIGDGCDTNLEVAHKVVPELLQTFTRAGIEVYDLTIATQLSAERCNLLDGAHHLGSSVDGGIDQFVMAMKQPTNK